MKPDQKNATQTPSNPKVFKGLGGGLRLAVQNSRSSRNTTRILHTWRQKISSSEFEVQPQHDGPCDGQV